MNGWIPSFNTVTLRKKSIVFGDSQNINDSFFKNDVIAFLLVKISNNYMENLKMDFSLNKTKRTQIYSNHLELSQCYYFYFFSAVMLILKTITTILYP